ncbi:hypothetical protein KL86CLO1_12205 [uncultured Eubacteriales bacterium]|uniref:Uncharacterized protein n=1 Tax=uncultured Eubacteriales bacterium TaxID=172733 RepID=A0A212K560_9FIRM|nr:hypothetical protein KL86CLO1_12205 [uncultured Eubacteriales bacterium]
MCLPASGSEPRRKARPSVFAFENLAAGAIHLPRGCRKKKGPQKKRSFVGNKRNKNAEISQRALEILEKSDI